MQNALKSNKWWRIWVKKTFKFEIMKERPNNLDFLQNWFPPEIRSPLLNLLKFRGFEKSTPESCRMHWNLMNDKEFRSRKRLKLNTEGGDQITQTFCKIIISILFQYYTSYILISLNIYLILIAIDSHLFSVLIF